MLGIELYRASFARCLFVLPKKKENSCLTKNAELRLICKVADIIERLPERSWDLLLFKYQYDYNSDSLADLMGTPEYEDYIVHPYRGNASALMEQITEQYIVLSEKRENYVDYISNRPGVEECFRHGLFTDECEPVVLSRVQKEAAEHHGVIWSYVISLRREDTVRLGYDNGRAWRDLLHSKQAIHDLEQYGWLE